MSHSTESLFEFEFGKSYKKYSASKESIESKHSNNDSKKSAQRKDSGYSLNNHLYHPHAALPSPISSPNDTNAISIMTQYRNNNNNNNGPNIYIVDNTPSPCSPKSPLSLSQSKSEQFDYLYCDRPNTAKSDGSGSRSSFGKRQHKKHKKGNPFARDRRDRDRIRKNNSDDYIDSVQTHRNRHHHDRNKDRHTKNRNNNNVSKNNPFSMNRRQHTASPKKYGHRNNNNPFSKYNTDQRTDSDENSNEMIKPKLDQKTQSNTIKTARDSINGLAKRIGNRSSKKREKSYKERRINKNKDNHTSNHKHRKTLSDVGVIANNLNFATSTTQKLKDRVTSSSKKYYKSRTKSPRISNDRDKNKSKNSKKLKKKHKKIDG